MSEFKLAEEIVARSTAKTWDMAKLEWALDEVYETAEPETCLCGHFPIIEICILANHVNGNLATVGNCCVKRFIGLPSDKIFQAVKRIRKDISKSLNPEAVAYARQKNWINDWELTFYLNVMRKRKLTSAQAAKKFEVNQKMLAMMTRTRRSQVSATK